MRILLNSKSILLSILLACLLIVSCKTEEVGLGLEPMKGLSGKWKVVQAFRNGSEITNTFDFSQFRLNFNTDKSYTMDSKLPFVVNKNGTWAFDDPLYPFKLKFTAQGSQEIVTNLQYPITNGRRQIKLIHSPGCAKNSYIYVFEEVAP